MGGQRGTRYLFYSSTVGALCARDYKGVGSQYVDEDKLIVEITGNDSGSSDTEDF